MSQEIRLGAIVLREGRLMLTRPQIGVPWELPGGLLLPEHEDTDTAMDEILSSFGINAPAIEDDFLETLYFPREEGQLVYNLYAASEWRGDPAAPAGMGLGWFALDELDAIAMDTAIRQAILAAFGLREPASRDEQIISALAGGGADEPRSAPDIPAPPGAGRHVRSLEVANDVEAYLAGLRTGGALDERTRNLQVIAMVAALGGRARPLRSYIEGALDRGVTPLEVVETLRLVAVYAGLPASVEAWNTMEAVFESRGIACPGRLA